MTLWTFNTGIPASGNDPSVDQPDMLNNNVSTNGILGTDHVTFNTQGPIGPPHGSGGQHLQVSFNGNNVPAVPTTVPTLFVNTQDGAGNTLPGSVQELFFYSGTATQSQNQYVSASNGSVMLMGGLILKWGAVAGVSNGTAITFVNAFPHNIFSLQVSGGVSSSPQPTINFDQSSLSTTGFTARITGTQPINLYYLAIGN